MKLIILLALISFNASAYETGIIIPLATAHTNDNPKYRDKFNNKNYGIGVDFQTDDASYSVVAIDRNSQNNRSVYFSANYRKAIYRDFALFAGVTVATGYDNGIAVFPVLSARLYSFKLSTTYPSSELFCEEDYTRIDYTDKVFDEIYYRCNDIISLQYIREF